MPAAEIENLVLKAVGPADSEEVVSPEEALRIRVERVIVRADRVEIIKAVTADASGEGLGLWCHSMSKIRRVMRVLG